MKTDPTVGRVMLYFPAKSSSHRPTDGQPLTAHVAKVNADGTINIAYHDQEGNTHAAQNVNVVQFGDVAIDENHYVTWMPYQAKQHEKHATAENQLIADAEKVA